MSHCFYLSKMYILEGLIDYSLDYYILSSYMSILHVNENVKYVCAFFLRKHQVILPILIILFHTW